MKSKVWAALAIIIFTASCFAVWHWHEKQYPSWKEEVQLSDGRVATITQKRKYFEGYGTDQSWLTISLPEMGGERTWHSYLIPMHLDVHKGKVYVYGRPRGPKQVALYGYPKTCIVPFVWDGSDFVRVPLSQVPSQLLIEENVYSCIPQNRSKKISFQKKSEQWCPPTGDRQQFTKKIIIEEYEKACDALAMLDRAERRSK